MQYVKLTKKFITQHLMPHLSQSHVGRPPKVPLWRVVKAIIYKLRTGTQWNELPVRQFFSRILMSWQSVRYHFEKGSRDNSWKRLWQSLLMLYRSELDMSSVELDGTHTPVKKGGEQVAYQKRKSCKTTNVLILTDCQGIPIAMSDPVAGNHHDLFEIEKSMQKIFDDLAACRLAVDGLFLNADAGFDSEKMRTICEQAGICANIDINKRNAKKTDYEYSTER